MSELLCLAIAILGFAGVVVTVCVIDLFVRVARLEDREIYPHLPPYVIGPEDVKKRRNLIERKRNGHI